VIVVSDTSVILNLCWLRLETLLPAIYTKIWVPCLVQREFENRAVTDSRFEGLVFPAFILVAEPALIPAKEQLRDGSLNGATKKLSTDLPKIYER